MSAWQRDHVGTALWAATLVWIVGMATVFPLGNDALEAVSVFTFDRVAFLIVAVLFTVTIARNPDMLRQWGRMEALMSLFLGIIVLSWVMTLTQKTVVDVKRDINLLLTAFVMPYMAFAIARHVSVTRQQVASTCRLIVVVVATYLIVVGLIQALVDWRFLVAEVDQGVHRSRARGPFADAVPYSALLALLVPIALGLRAHESGRLRRAVLLVLCIGLIEALLLGQLRAVWIAVPLALLYFAALCLPARKSAVAVVAGILGAIVLSTAGLDLRLIAGPNGAVLQPSGSVSERIAGTESIYNRVAVWGTALNMIVHRPLFGFGFGARTFQTFRGDYYASCCGVSPEWAIPCAVPHNEVLNVLVLLGAVGLVAYLGLLRELWRLLSAHAADTAPAHATLAASVQAGLIVLVITALLHDVMYLSAVQVLFFFFAGLATPASPARSAHTASAVRGDAR